MRSVSLMIAGITFSMLRILLLTRSRRAHVLAHFALLKEDLR